MTAPQPRAPRRPTILLVDDVELLLATLTGVLEREFDVVTAMTGAEALEQLDKNERISAIVCDYSMPGMTGLEVLEHCAEEHPEVGRIMLTGIPEFDLAVDAMRSARPHRFLCKPCSFDELLEAVHSGVRSFQRAVEDELEVDELFFSNESLAVLNRGLEERVKKQGESIACFRRLALELNHVEDLQGIARAAASAAYDALGARGVFVQINEPRGESSEHCLGPEMSSRMISEPLRTKDGEVGEIVVDVVDADGRELRGGEQNILAAIASTAAVAAHNEFRRRQRDEAQYATVVALARLSEQRDQETGAHLERVSEYCRLVAEGLVEAGLHKGLIDAAWIRDLTRSAPLHDIGKVGIPDSILLKKGKLTPGEWEVMKTHAQIGADTLRSVANSRHSQSYLSMGLDIALCHHERWDGSGYPAGLAGEAIPLAARILALADVYDALTTVRPYKTAWTHEEALTYIRENRATHFDPEVVDAFLTNEERANGIRVRLADEEPSVPMHAGPAV